MDCNLEQDSAWQPFHLANHTQISVHGNEMRSILESLKHKTEPTRFGTALLERTTCCMCQITHATVGLARYRIQVVDGCIQVIRNSFDGSVRGCHPARAETAEGGSGVNQEKEEVN